MKISVCVATYGDQSWMNLAATRAFPSALAQGAHEVIGEHYPDGTVASSRNALVEQATGTHIVVLDADDELAPGYIAAMEAAIERDPDPLTLFTPAVQIVRGGRNAAPTFFKVVPLRQANWLVIGTLVHRDLFWEVGGFDNHKHGYEDWALWSKCSRAGATVVKVPDAVYRYWANPNSAHRQMWRDKKAQRAEHYRVAAELDAWEAAR